MSEDEFARWLAERDPKADFAAAARVAEAARADGHRSGCEGSDRAGCGVGRWGVRMLGGLIKRDASAPG
jgi:hypothetical protein